MTDALAAAWMLFVVFCPGEHDCSFHSSRFVPPTQAEQIAHRRLAPDQPPLLNAEQACHRAKGWLAKVYEPDGSKPIRLMLCTREQRP